MLASSSKSILLKIIDRTLFLCSYILLPVLRLYVRFKPSQLPRTRDLFVSSGVYPLKDHYYYPMFRHTYDSQLLSSDRSLKAIDLNVVGQLEFLSFLNYGYEFIEFVNDDRANKYSFDLNNPSFRSGDAEILYQVVRHLNCHNVIEIGSGHSTKIIARALEVNRISKQSFPNHTCIEPYEMPWLENLEINLVRSLVEDVDTSIFNCLESGDLLFIDSSHMIRPNGDILKIYFEILPILKSGVVIHIHDIFTPRDYLKEWKLKDVRFWNEQYLLEALLMNSQRYRVLAGLNFLHHNHFSILKSKCPFLTADREPGSFYLEVA
jgi:hypothetical protein